MSRTNQSRTSLDVAAEFYLALPLLLFVVLWLKLWLALPAALLIGFSCYRAWVQSESLRRPAWFVALAASVVAGAWAAAGGIGHFVYANETDWVVRDAVLRDLTVLAWPPTYQSGSVDLVMRAPVAFYLVPALLGKLSASVSVANIALYVWTVLGVTLTLLLLGREMPRYRALVWAWPVFMLWSGLDIMGLLFMGGRLQSSIDHIEWWAHVYQYSSHSTLLFWVPNHALPAWIGVLLLWRARDSDAAAQVAARVICFSLLWSPLATVGLLPFALVIVCRRSQWRADALKVAEVVAAALVSLVVAFYLTRDGEQIARGWTFNLWPSRGVAFTVHIAFVALEAGLVCLILMSDARIRSRWLWVAGALLLFLPLLQFGPGNDIVMRGGIAAIAIICLATCQFLATLDSALRARKLLIIGLLSIGSITPMLEVSRSLTLARWPIDRERGLMEATGGNAPHYVAPSTGEISVILARR